MAGIRESSDTIERIGIDRTFRTLSQAELVLAVLDMTRTTEELSDDLQEVVSRVDFSS